MNAAPLDPAYGLLWQCTLRDRYTGDATFLVITDLNHLL